MSSLSNLPLIHDDSSYLISLDEVSEKTLRLTGILVYRDNLNRDPQPVAFRDLDPQAKDAIIRQINRRYVGRSILIS